MEREQEKDTKVARVRRDTARVVPVNMGKMMGEPEARVRVTVGIGLLLALGGQTGQRLGTAHH